MPTLQGEVRQGQGVQRRCIRATAEGAGGEAAEEAPGAGGGDVRLRGQDGLQAHRSSAAIGTVARSYSRLIDGSCPGT